ncbi:hypothetical protein [Azospirillum argentinense]
MECAVSGNPRRARISPPEGAGDGRNVAAPEMLNTVNRQSA